MMMPRWFVRKLALDDPHQSRVKSLSESKIDKMLFQMLDVSSYWLVWWRKREKNCAGLLIFVVEICKILHARKLCESSFWWRWLLLGNNCRHISHTLKHLVNINCEFSQKFGWHWHTQNMAVEFSVDLLALCF